MYRPAERWCLHTGRGVCNVTTDPGEVENPRPGEIMAMDSRSRVERRSRIRRLCRTAHKGESRVFHRCGCGCRLEEAQGKWPSHVSVSPCQRLCRMDMAVLVAMVRRHLCVHVRVWLVRCIRLCQ